MRRTLLATPWLADDLLERWFEPLDRWLEPAAAPARRMEMRETAEEYGVRLELPGFKPEEVSVEVSGDQLTIRAATPEPTDGEGWARRPERVSRVVRFEKPIDASNVEAQLTNGVLEVRLPKSDVARPRRIQVRSAGAPIATATPPALEHQPDEKKVEQPAAEQLQVAPSQPSATA